MRGRIHKPKKELNELILTMQWLQTSTLRGYVSLVKTIKDLPRQILLLLHKSVCPSGTVRVLLRIRTLMFNKAKLFLVVR
jgi:hypothetical protein